jgi:hypothetical protein
VFRSDGGRELEPVRVSFLTGGILLPSWLSFLDNYEVRPVGCSPTSDSAAPSSLREQTCRRETWLVASGPSG